MIFWRKTLLISALLLALAVPSGPARAADYYEVSLNSLVFVDTDIRKVLEIFSKLSNLNLFLDENVPNKKVTFFAQNMSTDLAIEMFVRTNGLIRKRMNKNTYIIYPKAKAAEYESEMASHVFILENDDPKKVINILKTIGKNTKVTLNERINGIVMIDTPENIETAKKIVARMDYKKPQVAVDVRLVEIQRDKLKHFGLKFDDKDYTPKEMQAFGTINSPVLVDMLIKDSAAEILAQPKLKVLDQEKAEINVGDRIPIEISTFSKNAAGDSILLNRTVQWEKVGIILQVEVSKIHNSSEVTLKVYNEVSSVVEYTKEGYPHIRTRNAKTVVRLSNNETVVIGGLINAEERTNIFKIPILSRLPGLGKLFKNPQKDRVNTEIIMFITPTVFCEGRAREEFETPPVIESELATSENAVKKAVAALEPPPPPLSVAPSTAEIFLPRLAPEISRPPDADAINSRPPAAAAPKAQEEPEEPAPLPVLKIEKTITTSEVKVAAPVTAATPGEAAVPAATSEVTAPPRVIVEDVPANASTAETSLVVKNAAEGKPEKPDTGFAADNNDRLRQILETIRKNRSNSR